MTVFHEIYLKACSITSSFNTDDSRFQMPPNDFHLLTLCSPFLQLETFSWAYRDVSPQLLLFFSPHFQQAKRILIPFPFYLLGRPYFILRFWSPKITEIWSVGRKYKNHVNKNWRNVNLQFPCTYFKFHFLNFENLVMISF